MVVLLNLYVADSDSLRSDHPRTRVLESWRLPAFNSNPTKEVDQRLRRRWISALASIYPDLPTAGKKIVIDWSSNKKREGSLSVSLSRVVLSRSWQREWERARDRLRVCISLSVTWDRRRFF